MKSLIAISDIHIGVIRSAGTTPTTAYALRQYILAQFTNLLAQAQDCDLLINGDLFDTEHIPYSDLLEVYQLLAQWLIENPESMLYLPPGNHDLSKTTTTMSSQQFLVSLLKALLPKRVVAEAAGHEIQMPGGFRGWIIPHMPNQEQFDLELKRVPKGVKYLFLHANFDNKFAVQSDHSLNLSEAQAEALPVGRIVMGHEHQRRMALAGKVMLPGNQIPSSVADCLGNKEKYFARITVDKFELVPCWEAKGSFQRIDWRSLGEADPTAQFIRVEGQASSSEAPGVITAISKLRKVHNAFVITNAVSIEGREMDGAIASMEKVANFNVVEALFKLLDAKNKGWSAKVKKIMEANDVSAT